MIAGKVMMDRNAPDGLRLRGSWAAWSPQSRGPCHSSSSARDLPYGREGDAGGLLPDLQSLSWLGLFDEVGLRKAGVVSGVAADVGSGTHYSQLQTLNEAYKVLQLRGQALHPLSAFH